MTIWNWLLDNIWICGLMIVLDGVWAVYTKSIADSRPIMAGIFSGFITMFSGVLTVNYVKDPYRLILMILGAIIGTVIVVQWQKKRIISDKTYVFPLKK